LMVGADKNSIYIRVYWRFYPKFNKLVNLIIF
jgi:hypothetical protein